MATTLDRVKPCWEDEIAPQLKAGKNVLIAAHGNSLRALVKMIDGVLDDDLSQKSREFLGDPEVVAKAAAAVAAQGKSG